MKNLINFFLLFISRQLPSRCRTIWGLNKLSLLKFNHLIKKIKIYSLFLLNFTLFFLSHNLIQLSSLKKYAYSFYHYLLVCWHDYLKATNTISTKPSPLLYNQYCTYLIVSKLYKYTSNLHCFFQITICSSLGQRITG